MKSFVLLALGAGAHATFLVGSCWNKPDASCAVLPAQSTIECWNSIKEAGIHVATCVAPSSTTTVVVSKTPWWPQTTVTSWVTATSTKTLPSLTTSTWTTTQTKPYTSTKIITSTAIETKVKTTTKTNARISTKTNDRIALATVTSTVKKTNTRTTTALRSAFKTETVLQTKKVLATRINTSVVSKTTTLSSTITSISSYTPSETCKAEKRNLAALWPAKLPDACSCFLTTTARWGVQTSKTTITVYPTVTKTSFIQASAYTTSVVARLVTLTVSPTAKITQTACVTSTKIDLITVTVDSLAVVTLDNVKKSTATVWVTEIDNKVSIIPKTTTILKHSTKVIAKTVLTTSTQTSTSIATTVQKSTTTIVNSYEPCAAPAQQTNVFSASNAALSSSNKVADFNACCSQCYGQKNCVFYKYNPSNWKCSIYSAQKKGSCLTDSCPKGKTDVTVGGADEKGRLYGMGSCAGDGPAAPAPY